jgi:hypothetical protein
METKEPPTFAGFERYEVKGDSASPPPDSEFARVVAEVWALNLAWPTTFRGGMRESIQHGRRCAGLRRVRHGEVNGFSGFVQIPRQTTHYE